MTSTVTLALSLLYPVHLIRYISLIFGLSRYVYQAMSSSDFQSSKYTKEVYACDAWTLEFIDKATNRK